MAKGNYLKLMEQLNIKKMGLRSKQLRIIYEVALALICIKII